MSGKPPRIGVTTSRGRGRLMWLFNWFALWRAGARAVRIEPGRPHDARPLDGLVIGGGDDIGAELYGGEIHSTIAIDPERDRLELTLLATAEHLRLPVLGICRGAQMINVFHGGTLHQDIHAIYVDAPRLRTPFPRKWIAFVAGTRVHRLIDKARDRVNVLHHQAVDKLGRDLRVAARDEHNMVQAIEGVCDTFLLGVQWHPEFLVFDRGQQRLYRALVAAARDHAEAEADRAPLTEGTEPCRSRIPR